MEFPFECSTRRVTCSLCSLARYQVAHKINSISCLLYKHTNDNIFDDFENFRPHSDDFQRLSKIVLNIF